ncbi:Cytochrome c peroxidase [Shimia gijangensis]|uniref:Cytochrome c peroxidase n=1 Tax=Shimia gijangensis TaxID=1470563 RepID=A0A1M6HWH0_9RHOB|nr:cytochrome c peroxidase [Shimia gijangensis]SHJ26562.1 Cytochrome c peroxidase [Shimia gijangensis]
MTLKITWLMVFCACATNVAADEGHDTLEAFGEALFFDENLSANRTQACATCHDPDYAFSDPREIGAGKAVSLGDDGESVGDRSAPTLTYVGFAPEFHRNDKGQYLGGFFVDGRATTLEAQAGEPPLNPIEMGIPDKASVVVRLLESPDYVQSLRTLFPKDTLEDTDATFAAMTRALAAYERTGIFAPFDSRYDRYLKGDIDLTEEENLGRSLFFARDKTNCSICHQFREKPGEEKETFSTYRYHNIGVPMNHAVRAINGLGNRHVDKGLFQNPRVDHVAETGRFKVPTLRNVAVTGPYMHNGVFQELRTVILFYNKYNSLAPLRQINPETLERWRLPEVTKTLAVSDLIKGKDLNDAEVDALVAFLKTLTDLRYEHLLDP